MITINDRNESRALYQDLQRNCPHYFTSTDQVQCITDPSIIADFERETGECIGVLYKMNNYEIFVVDLIKKDGELKLHGRIILPHNGVIIIPKIGDKFILEDQFRYPTCKKHLAFPRGHCEPGATPEEDAIRETKEELSAKLTRPTRIGKTYPETNSNAWYCSIVVGEVNDLALDDRGIIKRDGYEGILNLIAYTADEIDELITRGEINCGYTLAAWAIYKAQFP